MSKVGTGTSLCSSAMTCMYVQRSQPITVGVHFQSDSCKDWIVHEDVTKNKKEPIPAVDQSVGQIPNMKITP